MQPGGYMCEWRAEKRERAGEIGVVWFGVHNLAKHTNNTPMKPTIEAKNAEVDIFPRQRPTQHVEANSYPLVSLPVECRFIAWRQG